MALMRFTHKSHSAGNTAISVPMTVTVGAEEDG